MKFFYFFKCWRACFCLCFPQKKILGHGSPMLVYVHFCNRNFIITIDLDPPNFYAWRTPWAQSERRGRANAEWNGNAMRDRIATWVHFLVWCKFARRYCQWIGIVYWPYWLVKSFFADKIKIGIFQSCQYAGAGNGLGREMYCISKSMTWPATALYEWQPTLESI